MAVTFDDIRTAAASIAGNVVRTPCTRSQTLSKITGCTVVLKFETHQFTASFKDRGALTKLLTLSAQAREAGVIAMSAGNHAQAVAYHAQRLGVPATIVMPTTTPNVKVEHTRAFGAEVLLHGNVLDEAREFTEELARKRGLTLIHPYDDDQVIAGQGTVALEMLEDAPDLDVLLVPVGGGGLIAGCAIAAKHVHPQIQIIGVETKRFPSMRSALRGEPIICGTSSMADGIAVKTPGTRTLPVIRALVDDIVLVDEADIEKAVLLLLEVEKSVVEGAGAVGLAALLREGERFKGRCVGLVLSGGNIDMPVLALVIQRGLVRSQRMIRLVVEIPDVPGALAELAGLFGQAQANVVEVHHQRAFTNLALRAVEVEFVLQTRGPAHVSEITAALEKAGYRYTLPASAAC